MEKAISFNDHKEKYTRFRSEVYELTPRVINMPGVRLTPINAFALAESRKWTRVRREPPNGGWDWTFLIGDYRKKYPKRFEAAIWYGNQLCGLCLGKSSGKNIHARLEILEGSTAKGHPLKGRVAYVALTAMELYGYACGASEVRIIDPVDGAMASYSRLGYKQGSPEGKGSNYLYKTL